MKIPSESLGFFLFLHVMKKLTILFAVILLALVKFSCRKGEKAKILIVDGFSNHDWKQTTKIVTEILESSTLFEVNVSTVPAEMNSEAWRLWDPKFEDYDVVIQNCNNIQDTSLVWPENVRNNLEDYVSEGGGLYVLHSANNAFPKWEDYNTMIGLGWRNKDFGVALKVQQEKVITIPTGKGKDTYHGPRHDAVVFKLNDHPINKDMPKAWKTPNMELYKYARGPAKNLTVLSYANDPDTYSNWPVEWVVSYGKGRVYNSRMGHLWKGETYPDSYRCIGFQTTLIRATEWLAKGRTTYEIPNRFPAADTLALISK